MLSVADSLCVAFIDVAVQKFYFVEFVHKYESGPAAHRIPVDKRKIWIPFDLFVVTRKKVSMTGLKKQYASIMTLINQI